MKATKRVSDYHIFAVWLSKIGNIPIRYHRPIPDHATIKEVKLKEETTDEWYVCITVEVEDEKLPQTKRLLKS